MTTEDAEHWRRCSSEALRAAARLTDPDMIGIMFQIAAGYRTLAERSERQTAGQALRPAPGVSFAPEALRAITDAYDLAWSALSKNVGTDPAEIEVARQRLANAILSVADEDSRDPGVLRDAALQAFASNYRL